MRIPTYQLSHTDCTSLIIAHHNLTRLRYFQRVRYLAISWLEHRRPLAIETSFKSEQPKQLQSRLSGCKIPFFDTESNYQVQGTVQRQLILRHDPHITDKGLLVK